MKTKLHPCTQARIDKYARRKLRLYRNCRAAGSTPDYARFQAGFALPGDLTGKWGAIVQGRELHYHLARQKWQEAQTPPPPAIEILVFHPCDLHSGNHIEIWRKGEFSGSSIAYPHTFPWEETVTKARGLAEELMDPTTGALPPVRLATMQVYRDGDDIRARVTRLETL